MIAPPPIPHSPTSTTDGTAQVGLSSQRGGSSIPMARSTSLIAPTSGFSSATHRTATATPLSTAGRKRIVRNMLMPRILRFSRSDKSNPVMMYSGTESTMYFSVTRIETQNVRSSNSISGSCPSPSHCGGVMMSYSLKLRRSDAMIGMSQNPTSPISHGDRKR